MARRFVYNVDKFIDKHKFIHPLNHYINTFFFYNKSQLCKALYHKMFYLHQCGGS